MRRLGVVLCLISACVSSARSEVRLPNILSSHMVLQRDRPIHVWGWAEIGESVTVALNGSSQRTKADDMGRWSLYLPPQASGGPYALTVSGSSTIALEDILIGDVWFASGQSNMEMPLQGFPPQAFVNNAAEEIKGADQPNIRLLRMHKKSSEFPLRDNESTWTLCSPETAKSFSSVAYFFGRDLASREHVPIGLIDSTWGGTPAEAWTSMDTLSEDAALMPVFAARSQMMNEQEDIPMLLEKEQREKGKHSWRPDAASWRPGGLFNGMVAPAAGYGIKGVIWYQGESNSGQERGYMYQKVFKALIGDWRMHWHQGAFPFLFVQIANFGSNAEETWPVIREAQRRALSVANTAMAVTVDVGTPDNVHPPDKQAVGARLALAARALAYGEAVEYSGPLYRQATPEESGIRVWFDHAAGGLHAKGAALPGFEVAGGDHKFLAATARIDGATVFVSSEQIAFPKFVRYAWRNAPEATLYNSLDLPASPFTSEDEIGLTF